MGITGKAFTTGEIIHSNRVANLAGWIPNIDNLTSNVKDVQNCMIVPIFGHKEPFEDEIELVMKKATKRHDEEEEKQRPIAIFQFINKVDLKQIDEYDIAKIEAMRGLLGMTIDNASRHHSAINIQVGVQQAIPNVSKFAEKSEQIIQSSKDTINSIFNSNVQKITNQLFKNDLVKQE